MRKITVIQFIRYSFIALCLSLTACVVTPIQHDDINDPALKNIHQAFSQTVTDALNDPDEDWTSGWLGNMWVNFHEGRQRGLCYQWKYRVHAGVKETVHAQGWQLTGIVINQGADGEHHAVIVYDPEQIQEEKLLSANSAQAVFVLDAWRQGMPDIYHLSEWLQLARHVHVPAKLIEIKPRNYSELK